jgi:ATP-dependent Clp protease protease subunit
MSQKTIYINFFDEITVPKVNNLMAICSNLISQKKPDELYFLFSSPGGQVISGIVLYNFLKSLPVKITMHNTGSIDSIATVIFLAGDTRLATPNSTFLFHGVGTIFSSNSKLNLSQINEKRSQLEEDENKIAGIIEKNTKLSDTEIRELFRQGESKNLSFATDKGIICATKEIDIPKDNSVISINFYGK